MKVQSFNPATGALIFEKGATTPEEFQNKLNLAKKAFLTWSSLSLDERMLFLENYGKELSYRKNEIAKIISEETGKPLWESRNEIDAMISKIPISLQAYQERCPSKEDGILMTRFRPYGTVAVFGPFNFPGHLPNGHIIPALLAGNTVLFKPSELTSKTGLAIADCFQLPEGVFQIVLGGPLLGQQMVSEEKIDGIFFTGSLQTGMHISKSLPLGKILALEMGGNNPLIVSKIDDIRAACYMTIQSAFLTSGQRCSSARRLILPKLATRESFLNELIRQIKNIKIGPFTDIPEPFMGPLIHMKAAEKLLSAQEHLISQGAKILHRMETPFPGLPFVTPALLDVTNVKNLPDEEHFGPFLQVIFVEDIHEAIQEANQTEFGLTAGLFSTSQEEWELFYQKSKAGIVNWNSPLTGASSKAPFGGLKKSGNLRPSAYLAADYCSYPVASMQRKNIELPLTLTPGITL